jgi:hypothetical protein
MLAATRVLSRVQAHGITLVPDGDRLRFFPANALTPELLEELRQHKEGVLFILRRREARSGARQDTDKGQFFKGDWRQTWPHDFEVYRGERP